MANPMGEAWSWRKVKRKTDRDDALKLARMAALGELPTVPMPGKAAREYRALLLAGAGEKLAGRRSMLGCRRCCTSTSTRMPVR